MTRGLATLGICLMLGIAGTGQQPGTDRAADAAAVNDIVGRYVDARERADAAAIAALFTSDADQLVSSGEWRRGREERRERHPRLFKTDRRQADDQDRDDPVLVG